MDLWCIAEIAQIKMCDDNNNTNNKSDDKMELVPAMLRIHYLGWTLMLDEWISVEDTHRIRKIRRNYSLKCMHSCPFVLEYFQLFILSCLHWFFKFLQFSECFVCNPSISLRKGEFLVYC